MKLYPPSARNMFTTAVSTVLHYRANTIIEVRQRAGQAERAVCISTHLEGAAAGLCGGVGVCVPEAATGG
jgi:hypothetical protein